MILSFPDVINEEQHRAIMNLLAMGNFVDGRQTAGAALKDIKNNTQLNAHSEQVQEITNIVLNALKVHDTFRLATYPQQLHSLMVSRYTEGMFYGPHVDNALMGNEHAWRTDLSMTLFLNYPNDYTGGELCMESGSGEIRIKLPARHLVCYPTSSLHQVREVTRGERLVIVAWIQSHVRDSQAREALWDLAQARADIHEREGKSRAFDLINKAHANLLRRWADT